MRTGNAEGSDVWSYLRALRVDATDQAALDRLRRVASATSSDSLRDYIVLEIHRITGAVIYPFESEPNDPERKTAAVC